MAGIKVLDFSIMMSGPYCTRLLADLGAEVIKVEPPEGDPMRGGLPLRDGHSAYFAHLNAGKQSVVLDMKHQAGCEAALEMAARADIVVQNFRPGVMARMGVGYEAVRARNPGVVYVSISGFGQDGPESQKAAFAPMIHAASGLDLAVMGHQESVVPPASGIFSADVMSSLYAVIGIQAALAHRHETGEGQHLDVTLLESLTHLMPFEFQEAQFPLAAARPVYKPVRASDGFLMVVVLTRANFENLCTALGRPDLLTDARFVKPIDRAANRAALMREVEAWTLLRTARECEELLCNAGIACARYRTVRENLASPTFEHRRSLATTHDPAGAVRIPKLPFRMDDERPDVGDSVPQLGAATSKVLHELAGMPDDQVKRVMGTLDQH